MHRQSLGSPNSKLHSNGVVVDNIELITPDDLKTKHQLPPQVAAVDDEEQLRKSQKHQKSTEKLIHIIPMLIILCFLILYLTSHDPSLNKSVNNLNRNSKPTDVSSEIDQLRGVSATEKSGVMAIRSTRNLQQQNEEEEEILRKKRSRKLGDF